MRRGFCFSPHRFIISLPQKDPCFTTFIPMKQQNYKNHKQYYAPHHFIFLPLLGALIATGTYQYFGTEPHELQWMLFTILAGCMLYLTLMLRQHYALGNQDRIVRLEFRLRHFELTGKSASTVEPHLNFGQIAALRFADDEEFSILLRRALTERLSGTEIKKAIRNWQPDLMRV